VLSEGKPWPLNFKTFAPGTVARYEADFNENCGSFAEDLRGHHAKVQWLLDDNDLRERFEAHIIKHGNVKGTNVQQPYFYYASLFDASSFTN